MAELGALPVGDEADLALIAEAEAGREDDAETVSAPSLGEALVLVGRDSALSGREAAVLDTVSLTIPARSIVLLAGPSGAGKSTLADLAGGLISPDEGR